MILYRYGTRYRFMFVERPIFQHLHLSPRPNHSQIHQHPVVVVRTATSGCCVRQQLTHGKFQRGKSCYSKARQPAERDRKIERERKAVFYGLRDEYAKGSKNYGFTPLCYLPRRVRLVYFTRRAYFGPGAGKVMVPCFA